MRAYRLTSKVHQASALNGDGALLIGGRWHRKGQRVVHCSESRALAAIEFFVNLDPSLAPLELVCLAVNVPDDEVSVLDLAALPSNWRDYPAPEAVTEVGSQWIEKKVSAALVVPSAVLPDERNVLLNPTHTAFGRVKVDEATRFTFDDRMWKASTVLRG